jgi:glycosyltransferase involved in cell wall biosynthesis
VFEGMGIVLLEAFRASLPIVASNVEGPKELIKHGETGLLFEPKQPQKLAALIKNLYEDEDLRIRLGRRGKDEFENKFEMDQYAKRVEALYFS